jgi:rSAM/selenodomain-associated transferase 2
VTDHRISVVVPILNEQRRIQRLLDHLASVPGLRELIVVDGESNDGGADLAAARPGVTLVRAPRGRAAQMNAGAAVATGDVLLFVHADVSLPRDATDWIELALRDGGVVAGAFRTWTIADTEHPPWWAPLLHLADARSRYTSLPYGDQALFVRAETFRALGGFADVQLMEDIELGRRLWRVGRVVTVPASVLVSGRRFLARPVFYTLVMNLFPLLYRLGVSPKTLSNLYGHIR